jgi:hypothetical protein
MKLVRLSALLTYHLYHPGNIPGTHFCQRLSRTQGHNTARRIMSMKNYNDTSGIEPATFKLVAQCLKQLRHRKPLSNFRQTLTSECLFRYKGTLCGIYGEQINELVFSASTSVFPCQYHFTYAPSSLIWSQMLYKLSHWRHRQTNTTATTDATLCNQRDTQYAHHDLEDSFV